MRVAIDHRPALLLRSGIGRYVDRLTRALAARDDGPELALFAVFHREHAARLARAAPPLGPRVRLAASRLPARALDRLARVTPLSSESFTGPIDLFHVTDFVAPPLRATTPSVFTLHDLGFLDPRFHVPASAARLEAVTRRLAARSRVVITPSEATRRAAIEALGLDAEAVVVTPLGVDADLLAPVARPERARPMVLALGTLEPRKNLPRLLRAFERILARGREAELVLAGRRGWRCDEVFELLRRPALARAARWVGEIDEACLRALLRRADVVAYPSLLEGFGLPVLEGMACGAAVLTADRGATREVAGDGALLVDPESEDALADGLARLLDDAALRAEFGRRGRARAAAFTWARCAERTIAAYRRAVTEER